MPKYESIEDLPSTVSDVLPEGAQKIYLEVYNETWDAHAEEEEPGKQGRDSVAHRKAWTAMRHEYVKDEDTGKWYLKGELPEEEEEGQSLIDKLKDLV